MDVLHPRLHKSYLAVIFICMHSGSDPKAREPTHNFFNILKGADFGSELIKPIILVDWLVITGVIFLGDSNKVIYIWL